MKTPRGNSPSGTPPANPPPANPPPTNLAPISADEDFVSFAATATASLSRTAWLLTGSAAEADDLVQEALIRTYTAWPRVRRENALAYARKALVNRHVDRWRSSRRELAAWAAGHRAREVVRTAHESSEDRDELVRALQRLRPRERAIVVLRYYFDLSETQVAAELGVSAGTVKSTASRAIAKLRDLRAVPSSEAVPSPVVVPSSEAAPSPVVVPGPKKAPSSGAARGPGEDGARQGPRGSRRIAVRTSLPAAAGAAFDQGSTS